MKKFFCCFRGDLPQRQSAQEPPQQQAARDPPQQQAPQGPVPPLQQVLANHGVTFEWVDIVDGTQNFRGSNLLSEGNFGRVYRCDFPSHDAVGAAKVLRYVESHAQREFEAEITTLHRANHPNVIRFLGKVLRRGNICVVYEFMPNGSLDHHLFGQLRRMARRELPSLDWNRRMSIALGVAEALVYVHNVLKVIHRDVNSSNVLLDGEFVPKLTDFGLATRISVGEDGVEEETVIRPNKGTMGFNAPEREQSGLVSTKSDVYGYGILLFELFTGKKAYDNERPPATINMTGWFRSVRNRQEDMSQVIDVKLGDRYSVEGSKRLFQAASMCIDSEATARPNMDIVEQMVREASAYAVPDTSTVSI